MIGKKMNLQRKWISELSKEMPTVAFHASIQNSFGKGALINLLRQFAKLHKEKQQVRMLNPIIEIKAIRINKLSKILKTRTIFLPIQITPFLYTFANFRSTW